MPATRLEDETMNLLRADDLRAACLEAVRALDLPDGYLAAGFVRNAIWDHQHGTRTALNDVDVVYFDPTTTAADAERALEARLAERLPDVRWEARNQARMHVRNGHAPYRDTAEAIAHWPEVPTCIGVRMLTDGSLSLVAPFGLEHSWNLVVRPNPSVEGAEAVMHGRVEAKAWLRHWPRLRLSSSVSVDGAE